MLPGDVGGVIVGQEHRTVLRFPFDPTTAAVARHLPPRVEGPSAPGVGARIGRTTHEMAQRLPMRSMPVQLPPVGAARHAVGHLDVMLPQVTQQAAEAAQEANWSRIRRMTLCTCSSGSNCNL